MPITSGSIPKALPGGKAPKQALRIYTIGVKVKSKAKKKKHGKS